MKPKGNSKFQDNRKTFSIRQSDGRLALHTLKDVGLVTPLERYGSLTSHRAALHSRSMPTVRLHYFMGRHRVQ